MTHKLYTAFWPAVFILILSVSFSACNPKARYSSSPVKIDIQIDKSAVTSATIIANITPAKDVYYYCGIITKDEFNMHGYDYRFMQYMVDSLYSEYLDWRKDLVAASLPYVASFSSHSLGYGKDSRIFTNLKPNTDYVIYAFCVNPDKVVPMGDLFVAMATTADKSTSSLTFTYSIEGKNDGYWLTIEPSNDKEPYIYEVLEKEYLEYYESPSEFFEELLQLYAILPPELSNNLQQRGYIQGYMSDFLPPNTEYCLIVAGYDGDFTTPVYYSWFNYTLDMDDIIHAHLFTDDEEKNAPRKTQVIRLSDLRQKPIWKNKQEIFNLQPIQR